MPNTPTQDRDKYRHRRLESPDLLLFIDGVVPAYSLHTLTLPHKNPRVFRCRFPGPHDTLL
jgi:hypothetical protein